MVQITLDNIVPAPVPASGWIVGYRIKGTLGPFTTPPGSPFMAQPIVFTTLDPAGTLYEGFIQADCGALESTQFNWVTPCQCLATYSPSPDGSICQKVETTPPTVTNSGFCLAASTDSAYGNYSTRIYTSSFTDATLDLPPGSINPGIFAELVASPQWANPLVLSSVGPLNREGVWIDSDCNGVKDPLGGGSQTTIAFTFNNLGGARTIHVGVGADNQFQVVVNGAIIATHNFFTDRAFKIWHIIPVNIVPGLNYFNVIATGDGSVNDSVGMVVYDNTAAQIQAAATDGDLAILFKTSSLRGTSYDVTTCPPSYSLDTTGGVGNYVCTRTLYTACNAIGT